MRNHHLKAVLSIVLAFCAACTASVGGNNRRTAETELTSKLSLTDYCSEWYEPFEIFEMPDFLTDGSSIAFPAGATSERYFYMSNINATIYSNGWEKYRKIFLFDRGSSEALSGNDLNSVALNIVTESKQSVTLNDVETLATGTCDDSKYLFILDADYSTGTQAKLIAVKDVQESLSDSDFSATALTKSVTAEVVYSAVLKGVNPQKMALRGLDVVDNGGTCQFVLSASPINVGSPAKSAATRPKIFTLDWDTFTEASDSASQVALTEAGKIPLEIAILSFMLQNGTFDQQTFALAATDRTDVKAFLSKLSKVNATLSTKLETLLQGDLDSLSSYLDDAEADDDLSSLNSPGMDFRSLATEIDLKPGDLMGYSGFTEMKISADKKTAILWTLSGGIEIHFPDFPNMPSTQEFLNDSDRLSRLKFMDLKGQNYAQMEAMAIVPPQSGKAKTVWYSTERVPNYTSSAFTVRSDGSVYDRSPVLQMSCKN